MCSFRRIDQLPGDSPTDPGWNGSALVQTLTKHAKFFVFGYSPSLKSLVSWSDNGKEILGAEDNELVRSGDVFLRHAHPDDRFLLLSELEPALKGEQPYRATYRWIRPDDNSVRWLHCRATLNTTTDSSGIQSSIFEGIILDLNDEMTGSVSQLAGPDSLATVLAAFPTLVLTLSQDLRILRMNRPAHQANFSFGDDKFRHEQFAIGKLILDSFADEALRDQYASVFNALLDGTSAHFRTRLIRGETVYSLDILPLNDHGAINGLLCTVTDITEHVRLEAQVAALKKNEGLRLLASGVAHNFNNALQSIIGHAAAIENHPENPEVVTHAAQAIQEIVQKTSGLSRQLFAFEDSGDQQLVPVDLNVATMAAVNRIEDLFSSGASIDVAFGNPGIVLARQEPLVSIIEAIIRNAKESTPASGSISIKTYQATLEEFEVGDLKAGSYARLSVSDTGKGMNTEERQRCLEPFFTTKNTDPRFGIGLTGQGLGLSRAAGLVKEFKGAVDIESSAGEGTTVSIYFPAQQSAATGTATEVLTDRKGSLPEVLVIDDDLAVLETMRALLNDLGYQIAVADGFKRALSLAKTHQQTLRLVLIDAVMPGMNGATLLRRLKKISPGLKVIGFSGAPPEYTKQLVEAGALEVLRKPVDLKTLRDTVRRELETALVAA